MKKISRKYRKIFLMLFVVLITAITLAVGTYAWFVGLSTASTNDITIAISAVDGLELSLNGQYWTSGSNPLLIKDSTHTYITETGCSNANCAYTGHHNVWPSSLTPVSLYPDGLNIAVKQSLVANPGGYYIYARHSPSARDKMIIFDLFIRNGRGSNYNVDSIEDIFQMVSDPEDLMDVSYLSEHLETLREFDIYKDDEDIYLSADSFAKTVANGAQPDFGAANSIRVGFYEMISMASNDQDNLSNLQAWNFDDLSFNNMSTRYNIFSFLFYDYIYNIWEPNHASHSTNAVDYYNQSCKIRTGEDVYSGSCIPIESGSSKKTYPYWPIANKRNIYDGPDLNTYWTDSDFITNYITYTYKTSDATSTDKNKTPLLKLQGNSITKVKVMIWLEGQDIDNYDVISKNPSVQVKFGFTKDRFGLDETNNSMMNSRASSFQDDSWEKIQYNIQHNNTSQYNVGDMRTVRINGKQYRLRLVNKSSPSTICSSSSNSQTACGFVVEFFDAVASRPYSSSGVSNWSSSDLYSYLQGDFYNSLPDDLKKVIINTKVVSGGESSSSTSTDKVFLLSEREVNNTTSYDNGGSATRQLDYYNSKGVSVSSNKVYCIKQYANAYSDWWLRNLWSGYNWAPRVVSSSGELSYGTTGSMTKGVAPAFRIG